MRKGLTDPTVNVKQDVIEELSRIIGVERCVMFGIGQEQIDGQAHISCEIVAGVPLNEYESKLHQKLTSFGPSRYRGCPRKRDKL